MKYYSFEVPGRCAGKARPRVHVRGGHAQFYSPDKDNFQARVSLFARDADIPLLEPPVEMQVVVHRSIPKSWSKKKRMGALATPTIAFGKPDSSNILSAICDGLIGIAYQDDSAIGRCTLMKIWAEKDSTVITVNQIE